MRLYTIILLSIIILSRYANAQSLPANPWANGAVETYASSASENKAQIVHPQPADSEQSATSIKENLDTLMQYFATTPNKTTASQQIAVPQTPKVPQKAQALPSNTDVLMLFLQRIGSTDNAASENKSQQQTPQSPTANPVTTAYDQYMREMRRKIDDAAQKARNYCNDAVGNAKNFINNGRKNLFK